mmetsp:Transcript_29648/g.72105  ORF Transcript_29648/g.72105 Transcript_29648/m.72105 type:complete len:397 (+) Transcript_29648:160-1350(+)
MQYVLLCLGGAEAEVATLLAGALAGYSCAVTVLPPSAAEARLGVAPGATGVGKVLVTTAAPPEELLRLRCVQGVLALVAVGRVGDTVDEVAKEMQGAMATNFTPALDVWRHCQCNASTVLTFRVSCLRGGAAHAFNSVELSGRLGASLLSTYPTLLKVDLVEHDVEVLAIVYGQKILVGLTLGVLDDCAKTATTKRKPPSESHRLPYAARPQREFALRPSTAAVLAHFAQLQPGEVVLDPMCGMGTIPIEAAIGFPVYAVGGDIDSGAVNGEMRAHVTSLAQHAPNAVVDALVWDSTLANLRPNCIDAVIVDAPFGLKCGKWAQLEKLLRATVQQTSRLLRPGGRALFLVHSFKKFRNWYRPANWLDVYEQPLNIGGLVAHLVIMHKPHTAPSARL